MKRFQDLLKFKRKLKILWLYPFRIKLKKKKMTQQLLLSILARKKISLLCNHIGKIRSSKQNNKINKAFLVKSIILKKRLKFRGIKMKP